MSKVNGSDAYASRKRGLISTVASYENELQSYPHDSTEQTDGSNDVMYWKKKYENLKDESKAKLIEFKETKKLVTSLTDYATLLEEKMIQFENSTQSQSQTQAHNHSKSATNVANSSNDSNLNTIELQRKLLNFYEVMTCMKVEMTSATSSNNNNINSDEYVCTVRNKVRRIATRFILRTPSSSTATTHINTITINQNMDFVPKVNLNYLPEYLRAHVNFEASNAPVMMGDILQTLFNDDSGSEEAD